MTDGVSDEQKEAVIVLARPVGDHHHVEVDGVVVGIGNLGQAESCGSNAAELREKPDIAEFLREAEREIACPWCLT